MPLDNRILNRAAALGASHGDPTFEMEPAIRALKFPHPLFKAGGTDGAISPADASAWLAKPAAQFYEEIPRGMAAMYIRTFEGQSFKPFTEGSSDVGAWGDLDEAYFRKQVSGVAMEFIEIGYLEGGYPDLFNICLSDPDQTNPQVYATDHETSWEEISQQGDLLTFLNRFATEAELKADLERLSNT